MPKPVSVFIFSSLCTFVQKSGLYVKQTDYFRDQPGNEGQQSCIRKGMRLNRDYTGKEANVFAPKMREEQMHSCEHRTARFVHLHNLDILQRQWRTRSSALLCLSPPQISVCDTATLFRCHFLERCLLSLRLRCSWALPRRVKTWRWRYMLWAWWVCVVCEHKELGAKQVTTYLLSIFASKLRFWGFFLTLKQ